MGHRRNIGLKIALAAAVLTSLILLSAWGFRNGEDSLFYITDSTGQEILTFDQGGEELFLVLRSGESITAYALNLESGQLMTEPLNSELGSTSVVGSSLGIYYRDDVSSSLTLWNTAISMSDAKEAQYLYFTAAAEERLYTFTSDGTLYAVSEEGELEQWTPFEPDSQSVGLVDLEFLTVTPDEWIYAYAAEILYRWKGSDLNSIESWRCSSSPAWMVGEEAFVDMAGTLFLVQNEELQPAPESLDQLDTSRCYINGDEMYTADSEGTIYRHDVDGTITGWFELEGEILRLSREGVLVEKDGKLWFSPYLFQDIGEEPEATPAPTLVPSEEPTPSESPIPTEEPTPTPEPTPTETPTPEPSETSSPSPEPGEDTEASPTPAPSDSPLYSTTTWDGIEYVLLNDQMTAKKLRDLMKPQAVLIRDLEGNPVSEGVIKTGMTMDDKVIVILGDCNGSGYVNSKDIELASMCILGGDYLRTDAAFLAVDLNRDGSLTLRDLVLLSSLIDKYE